MNPCDSTTNSISRNSCGAQNSKIPSPRLELRWIQTGETWQDRECIYSLVFPLKKNDIRSDFDRGICDAVVELGRTNVGGGNGSAPIDKNGSVQTPFRDGVHAQHDREALGGKLPIIAICGDVWTEIPNWLSREVMP